MVKEQIQTEYKRLTLTGVQRGILYTSVQLHFILGVLVFIALKFAVSACMCPEVCYCG